MAPEDKQKERKASVATTIHPHPPSKKSKKVPVNGTTSDLLNEKTQGVANDPKNLQKLAVEQKTLVNAAAMSPNNEAVVKSRKWRKRAADYMDEDNGSLEGAAVSGRTVAINGETDEGLGTVKSKKSKKSRKTTLEENVQGQVKTDDFADPSKDYVAIIPVEKANNNKKKSRSSGSKDEAENKPEKPVPKKKQSTSAFHADRLDQLLSHPVSEWPLVKKNQQTKSTKRSLTADAVNGALEDGSDPELDTTTANRDVTHSLQTEGQHTQDQELEEEYGREEDRSDNGSDGDQGAALLAGFDSDGEDSAEDEDFDPKVTKPIPDSKATKKLIKKAMKNGSDDGPGTVYVGRIPHGFYEHQMRAYFSQFGTITKLRLSRNRKTGASKHFAFIEFESNEVAKIVAETMDNYLMFGHILKCKYAPQETLHPDTWKGANKRYKKLPYNKLEKKALEAPKTTQQWEFKINKEQKKREAKAKKMKELGYEMLLPKMKAPGEVLQRNKLQQAEKSDGIKPAPASDDKAPAGALEAPNGMLNDEVAKRLSKKDKKGKMVDEVAAVNPAPEISNAAVPNSAAAISAVELVNNKKKQKERRNMEKMLKNQLQAELHSGTHPSTSETVYETPVTPAFATELPQPVVAAAAETNLDRKKSKKAKSSRDNEDTVLPSVVSTDDKKTKKEKRKWEIEDSAPATLPLPMSSAVPETAVEAGKKVKIKKRKSDADSEMKKSSKKTKRA